MEKLNWGLIGCGDIARRRVAPALRDLENCDLVAVSRADFSRAPSFAKQFGARKWFRSWHDLVSDEAVAAVYIATPVDLHAEQAIGAAEAGKHVLCEKPMAIDAREADTMIEVCRANGVQIGVAYYRHFYPVIRRIKEIIAAGEIGRVVTAQINVFERFAPQPGEPRHWLVEKERAGGGPMMDVGCHRIEVLQNILGRITQTRAALGRIVLEREVEDTGTAHFTFEHGATGVLNVSHAISESQDTLALFGTEGSIHSPSLNEGTIVVKTAAGERTERWPPHANIHLPLIENFAHAVLHGQAPEVDGEVGRAVTLVEDEIYDR